jgi:hypothetical protein
MVGAQQDGSDSSTNKIGTRQFRQYTYWHGKVTGIKDAKKRALLTRLAAEFSVSAQRAEPSRMELLQPPKVIKRPYTVVGANGERREDPYYWLRDDKRENPEVLEHLKAGSLSQGSINELSQALCCTCAYMPGRLFCVQNSGETQIGWSYCIGRVKEAQQTC